MAEGGNEAAQDGAGVSPFLSTASRARPFRFKDSMSDSSTSSKRRSRKNQDQEQGSRRSHKGSRHRSHQRSRSRSRSPRQPRKQSLGPGPRELSPESAFRESLFDAMADDEGAAYWEGVYGQPIHNFGPMSAEAAETYEGDSYNDPQVLDADAYAAFVRRKMWERSHQHIIEERRKREEERSKLEAHIKRERERVRDAREHDCRTRNGEGFWDEDGSWRRQSGQRSKSDFMSAIDDSLRRGAHRKEEKRWRQAWERYNTVWANLSARPSDDDQKEAIDKANGKSSTTDSSVRATTLPWPVCSGQRDDVDGPSVRAFFTSAPAAAQRRGGGTTAETPQGDKPDSLRAQLKLERVRWHPDKIMQRLAEAADPETMKTVTAVFQTIDQMWNESKDAS